MLLRLNPANNEPLFQQIAAQVRGVIARGEVAPGERLMAARELAEVVGVNVHTVLRAYQLLADDGLVEMRRGRGVTVVEEASTAELTELARRFVMMARRFGLADSQIREVLEVQL